MSDDPAVNFELVEGDLAREEWAEPEILLETGAVADGPPESELRGVPLIATYREQMLNENGIRTLADLAAVDIETLAAIKTVGMKNALKIKDWLAGNKETMKRAGRPAKEDAAPEAADALELASVRFIGDYRARNLAEIGIRTMADLLAADEAVIGAVKGVGPKNAIRIKASLAGNADAPRRAPRQAKANSASEAENGLELASVRFIGDYRANNLAKAGIRTMADLVAADEAVLGAVKGVGPLNAKRIKASLGGNTAAPSAVPVKKSTGKVGRPKKVAPAADVRESAIAAPVRRRGPGRATLATTADPASPPAADIVAPPPSVLPDNEPVIQEPTTGANDVPTDVQLLGIAVAQIRSQIMEGNLSNRFTKQCDRLAAIMPEIETNFAAFGKKDRKNVTRALDELTDVASAAARGKKRSAKWLDTMYEEVKSARKRLAGLTGS